MLKNVGSNWALNIVQILVFMVITPFVVSTFGRGTNGVWESLVALSGPLQLLVLGVPMASVRYVGEHVAKGDTAGANRAVSTCMAVTLVMGVVALVTGWLLSFGLAELLTREAWALGPEEIEDAKLAYFVLIGTLAVGFVLRLPYGIYDAHQDFVARNLIMGGGLVLKLALTLTLLNMRATLATLAIVQFVTMAAEFATARLISRRRHPGIRFGLGHFDRSVVREVLSFSIFAMVLNMGAMLAFRIDALVIGAFETTPEQITVYSIGNKIFDPFLNLVLAIGMVVMPMATALRAKGESAELRGVFLKWSKICAALVLMVGTYLLVLGPEFLDWWFDEYTDESGLLLQVLMVSFLVFLPIRGVALPILMGLGRPGRPALGLLVMGLANVGLSIALIGPYGLKGVALGTAIPNVLFAGFVLAVACAELDVRPGEYVRYVLGRAVVGVLPAFGLLLVLKLGLEVEGFAALFLSGLGFVALFGLLQVTFVFRGDPHVDLYAKVIGRLRPAAGGGE